MNLAETLKHNVACIPAQEWASGKTWQEVYDTCHRGDWLLWLFRKTNPYDLQLLTLAKSRCANTIRHLMKDERSIRAVDVAEQYGLGNASLEALRAAYAAAAAAADAAAYAADAAADAAYAAAAYAADAAAAYAAAYAADAAYAAAYAAAAAAAYAADAAAAAAYAADAAAAYAADAADADAAAADAAAAAKKKNQQLTADIVRQTISIEKYNIEA